MSEACSTFAGAGATGSDPNTTARCDDPGQPPSSDDPLSPRRGSADKDQPGPGPSGLHVDLQHHIDDCDPPTVGWLDAMLVRAAALARAPAGGEVGVTLVGDPEMTDLHARYKHQATTTDVLSFDYRDDPCPDQPIDGDLVICLDEAARQAKARGRATRLEVLLYGVHGLLHLLGEDDLADNAYRRMHRREDALLADLGVGALFRDEPSPAPPAGHESPVRGETNDDEERGGG